MPKINPRIKSIDDLLGLDAAEESPIEPTPSVSLPTKNTIITLPPQAIRAFRGHPFRLYEGDRLNDLVESISEHGVLNPAIIRKIERDEDGFEYEMLAGHNRQNAAAIANRELPCIVKENLSDEDAWIYVIETNVLQRSFSEMLPSEKAAVLALRQAIAEYLHRTEGLSYDPASQIVVTPGAMGALFLALKVLLNPGDEVIVNEPCWTNYVQQIRMCGGVPVSVKTNAQRGFDLDVSAIAEAVTDKTKAIILNSPCNPTGAVASTETLLQLAELAQKQDLVILADEVYKHILFDGRTYTSFAALPGMKERTLVIDSLSKTYAMTGWRIGYAAGPENVIRNMVKLQENVSACAATPCQVAAIEALEGPQDHLKYMVEQYRLRRDYVMKRISEIPGLSCHAPAGTFYAFIDISQLGMPCEEFAMKLLEERQVVVVPGTAFGEFGEGYIRLSYATSMQCLEQGLQELEEFVRSHETKGDPA